MAHKQNAVSVQQPGDRSPAGPVLAALAVVLVGLSLRVPITALASVLPEVQRDLGLSASLAGLLSSLPMVCFGIGAVFVAPLSRRVPTTRLLAVSVLLLAIATFTRPWGGAVLFVGATVMIGLTIAVGNVLVPVVIRRDFEARRGLVLALSTASITVSGMLGAALTVPLANWLGWRAGLAVWGVVMLAALVSLAALRDEQPQERAKDRLSALVWKLPAAWVVSVYFGLVASLFYVLTVWLPTILPALSGASEAQSGSAAALYQAVGIVGALLTPVLLPRLKRMGYAATGLALFWVVALGGLMLWPELYVVWCIVAGVGQGCLFSMVWALVTLRGSSVAVVRDLSVMTQAIGYGLSIVAPVLFGAWYEVTGSWHSGLTMLLGMAVLLVALTPIVATRKSIG